ncbi:MAG: hypothetical protein NTZ53_12985 [Cyanobacteria bacterium]|nr:hypothetical protein [Cyanobacteriota bacterium]
MNDCVCRSSIENDRFFCIGHKPPEFSPSDDFVHVTPVVKPGLIQLYIPDDCYGDRFHGSILSEYCQLFGLAEYLKSHGRAQKIYLFQYRKYLSIKAGASVSPNLPYAYACGKIEANLLFPKKGILEGLGDKLLLGPAIPVKSLADNYSSYHHAEDFSSFVRSLSSVPGFDEKRIAAFVDCKVLFPAPSLGLFAVECLIGNLDILRSAWQAFSDLYWCPREGYQRRVGGFLLERLQSFLIFEDIISPKKIATVQGHQIVVSERREIARTE